MNHYSKEDFVGRQRSRRGRGGEKRRGEQRRGEREREREREREIATCHSKHVAPFSSLARVAVTHVGQVPMQKYGL